MESSTIEFVINDNGPTAASVVTGSGAGAQMKGYDQVRPISIDRQGPDLEHAMRASSTRYGSTAPSQTRRRAADDERGESSVT